jgi:hypothetical protein
MKILIPFALFAGLLGFAARSDAQAPVQLPQAAAPAAAAPARPRVPPAAEPRERFLLPAEPEACCDPVGGPEEGFDLSAIDARDAEQAEAARWRLPDERSDAQRLTPTPPRPLNRLTIRF